MPAAFLIVDDSHGKVFLLRHILQRAKWQGDILVASTTDEAKKIIDDHPEIGAAFVDYYVPRENGPAVIRYLKSRNPVSRIALVSSADSEQNAAEAKRSGAEAVVCSSYAEDEVEHELLHLLGEWMITL